MYNFVLTSRSFLSTVESILLSHCIVRPPILMTHYKQYFIASEEYSSHAIYGHFFQFEEALQNSFDCVLLWLNNMLCYAGIAFMLMGIFRKPKMRMVYQFLQSSWLYLQLVSFSSFWDSSSTGVALEM